MNKLSKKPRFSLRYNLSRFTAAAVAVLLATTPVSPLSAQSYDEQIQQKKREAEQLGAQAQNLRVYGDSLQAAVNNLNTQIAELESRIAANQKKLTELKASIAKAEADIAQRNEALADNLKMMYHEGQVSNLEKVASSKSISDFVDKQESRNRLQDRISTALDEIKVLKGQLETQKTEVNRLIAQDEAMRAQVAAQRAEQARLLQQTRGEEAAYQEQIKGVKAEISRLQAEQAALNRQRGGTNYVNVGGTGGYPWYNQPMFPCPPTDDWGMCLRQCVSYTAWKVAREKGYDRMPFWGGVGNANEWPGNARRAGIPVGYEPRAGSVAILEPGQYGHAMWVEDVLPGGRILVSEYNYEWDGRYSERIQTASGLTYIYF